MSKEPETKTFKTGQSYRIVIEFDEGTYEFVGELTAICRDVDQETLWDWNPNLAIHRAAMRDIGHKTKIEFKEEIGSARFYKQREDGNWSYDNPES